MENSLYMMKYSVSWLAFNFWNGLTKSLVSKFKGVEAPKEMKGQESGMGM